MKRLIFGILSMILVASLLAACGGSGASSGSGTGASPGATSISALEPDSAAEPAITTYTIGGYYTVDIPSDCRVEEDPDGRTWVRPPEGAAEKWRVLFRCDTDGRSGFDAMKQFYSEKEADTFALITVGGLEGYSWSSDGNLTEVSIAFPFAGGTGEGQPNGAIAIKDMGGNDATVYLEDPIVLAMLASVRLLDAPTTSGGPTLEQEVDAWLAELGTSLEELKPQGAAETDVSGSVGSYTVSYFYAPSAEVDAEAVVTGAISQLQSGADGGLIYDMTIFRDDPSAAEATTVEALAETFFEEYSTAGVGTADFGLFMDGTPVSVYLTFGIASSGGESKPVLSIKFVES